MSEISPAQLAANRANAALSSGPTTEEGKKRSSLNATRHGLAARAVVLPREGQNEYLAFSKKIIHDLDPGNTVERELAQLIADQQWRLKRAAAIENAMMGIGRRGRRGKHRNPHRGRADLRDLRDLHTTHPPRDERCPEAACRDEGQAQSGARTVARKPRSGRICSRCRRSSACVEKTVPAIR